MALSYPTNQSTTYESQQFGPVPPNVPGYFSQPPMYAYSNAVAYWTPYKGWAYIPHYHNGLDIAGSSSNGIKAMEAGKVTYSGWRNNGGGYVLEIEIRPGTRYSYNHCSRLLVRVGAIVAKGQTVAYIGATGTATGNHVHVSLDIQEKGTDNVYRWLMWNPKLWMAGGAYANDGRITPAYSKQPRLSAGISTDGVNIRTSPRLLSTNLFAHTVAGRIRRYSDNADLGSRTSKMLYFKTVQGDVYWLGGKADNRWVEFYVGGGHRFVAAPFATQVRWY